MKIALIIVIDFHNDATRMLHNLQILPNDILPFLRFIIVYLGIIFIKIAIILSVLFSFDKEHGPKNTLLKFF